MQSRRMVRKVARWVYHGLVPRTTVVGRLPAAIEEPVDPLWVREEQVRRDSPGLVRHRDRLAEVRDDLLASDALLASLDETTAVLRRAGLPFALVPDSEPCHRLAIAPGDRDLVLKACAEAFHGRPVYADLLEHGWTVATVLAETLPDAVAAIEHPRPSEPVEEGAPTDPRAADDRPRVRGVRLYRPVVTSGRTLHYGADHGCDLEFWESVAPPSHGVVASLGQTPFGWWVPSLEPTATIRIGDRAYPTTEAFSRRFVEDVDFPVDAVISWVDDSDPAWRHRRSLARAGVAPDHDHNVDHNVDHNADHNARPHSPIDDGDHRYRNRDELRYCLRSIAMYAPWIRHIFLVTDRQTPTWLDTTKPGLTVVSHEELFADRSALPVFNSCAIETQLHRIPGLAEHFLYLNDDVFLGRGLRPQAFFAGSGQPRLFRDSRIIPPESPGEHDIYVAAQQATRKALEDECGRTFTQVLAHTPHPLRRSILLEAEHRWSRQLADTSRSKFRSATDIAPVTLAAYLGYLTSRAVSGRLTFEYLEVDRRADHDRMVGLAESRGVDTFCLADGQVDGMPRNEQDTAVVGFLQSYFPVAGPFELRTAPPAAVKIPAVPGQLRTGVTNSGRLHASRTCQN